MMGTVSWLVPGTPVTEMICSTLDGSAATPETGLMASPVISLMGKPFASFGRATPVVGL